MMAKIEGNESYCWQRMRQSIKLTARRFTGPWSALKWQRVRALLSSECVLSGPLVSESFSNVSVKVNCSFICPSAKLLIQFSFCFIWFCMYLLLHMTLMYSWKAVRHSRKEPGIRNQCTWVDILAQMLMPSVFWASRLTILSLSFLLCKVTINRAYHMVLLKELNVNLCELNRIVYVT